MIALAFLAAVAAQAPAAPQVSLTEMQDYGRCVANRQPGRAARLLDGDYRTEEYNKALRLFAQNMNGCVDRGGRLRSGQLLFAGALAEGLLAREYKTGLAAALVTPAVPIASRSETETMALCLAMKAPAETEALLATKPASPEEGAAIKPLVAALPDCLVEGQQMTLNKPGLRAVLALAALRVASAPKPAGAAK
ncbi:hypothetical protein [Sphingomonas astaxanthinifaciens]|uniref:Sel1 repeat-containing protein n=1 Tax=Sphingomonas astaxanthinifaciens DSM 22298 TaxID=1123267 RepID=A0ABQ5Z9E8_9SPHN|nr:hypothetical protein [Sphingomonas astaxanthinifaciens]GLR48557.1 hypothetical protein GCM10007925_22740 [Sphingomonas astaxanthinifaciens DSM 22298]